MTDEKQTASEALADEYDDAAEALSDMTDRPKEDFEPDDEYDHPDIDELELVGKDDDWMEEAEELMEESTEARLDYRKRVMWTAFREAWFQRSDRWTDRNRPEREEQVARTVFEEWYSSNYE